jgi:ribosome biogenesis protein BRX1
MKELRITGNCLKWSRPLVVFDPAFDSAPHLSLLKEMFTHVRFCSLAWRVQNISFIPLVPLFFLRMNEGFEFLQVFSVPKDHPKSKPFIDHVISLSILDNRIWFRNYQVLPLPLVYL